MKMALISVHPDHVAKILSGVKVFEYRKMLPSINITHLAIYCTAPIKRIVAVAEVCGIKASSKAEIWQETRYGGGISRAFFRSYFERKEMAGVVALGRVFKILDIVGIDQLEGCKAAPQSITYLTQHDAEMLFSKIDSVPAIPASRIFLGGIHGVGKSTMCRNIFEPLGYYCASASALIRAHGKVTDHAKRVSSVSSNQDALIAEFSKLGETYPRILLDGHFTLIDTCNMIRPIDISVFEEISPTIIVMIRRDPGLISGAMMLRDDISWSNEFVREFQDAEIYHAEFVSRQLKVPLIIHNAESRDLRLANKITKTVLLPR